VSVSLPDRLGRLGRAGAGVLLVLGLASGLEPIIQAASSSPASAQTNLIQNGSFEEPTNTSDASLPAGSTGINGITDWTIGGNSVNLDSLPYWQAEDGSQSLDLSGNFPGSVSQTVTGTTAGTPYTLSWWMAGNPECGQAVKTMAVYWNGALVDEPTFDTTSDYHLAMGWVEQEVNVVGTGNDTVEFADVTPDGSSCGANLDNVTLEVSPVSTTLSVGSPTVAGVETVPESAVPSASVGGSSGSGSGDAAAAPLSSIPLSSIALASSPLHSIPLSSIPLSSIAIPVSPDTAVAAAEKALSSKLLSDIGITYDPAGCTTDACSGWNGILAGSEYAGVPLESVTLEDVLQDTTTGSGGQPSPSAAFDSVNLNALDLSSSPLSSIPLSSIELGSLPLSSIGLLGTTPGSGALTQWCTTLASLNFPCSEFGISGTNDNGVTLLSLALAGVPLSSIPLSSIPLSSIDLAKVPLSSIPLSSIPLSSINLASSPLSSIPLSSIPLSSIPLSSIPLSSILLGTVPLSSIPLSSIPLSSIPLSTIPLVVDCGTYGSCSTATLRQAAQAGALLPTATLLDLPSYNGTTIGELPPSALAGTSLAQLLIDDVTTQAGYPTITLGDLLASTMPPSSYPWQSVSLPTLPLAADGSAGGTVTYTLTLTLSNEPATVLVDLNLPPTFSYVPGSSTITGEPSLTDPTPAGSSLEWALALEPATYTLTFGANAGIGIGAATATVSTSIGGTTNSTSSATVDVVDGEQPTIDTPGSSATLTPGTLTTTQGDLNIGYLTSPGDLDDWSVGVSAGEELSLALTNLPATYDLELFGPNGPQLQGTPSQDLAGVSDTLPSITPGTTTEATPGSQDLPVTPPPGDQLEAVSNNPDGQSQYIQTPPLAAGRYIVQVSGYNGVFSQQPYLLQANLLGGETAPSCPGGISYPNPLPDAGTGAATAPSDLDTSIPNNVNTLLLVNTQRLSAAFGSQFDNPGSGQATIVSDLNAIASDSSAGVSGAVVPVDTNSSVQQAYAVWNANPCSVAAANGVVTAIAGVVDQLRTEHPTIQNLVIVGADDQIPFARIADGATQSNERDYGAATFAGENNVEADALSLGYYLSDDPYASDQPLGVGSATLYTPELAVGRLVESAPEIESALTRFVSSSGNLDATASLTTGYSFLTSGAEAVEANLAADGLNSTSACDLISESWAESDLDTALAGNGNCAAPGVDSVNAHFDYSRALPAYDNTKGTTSNLFTTTDVRNPPAATSYAGRLLFSMGCHAGLTIDDAEVDSSIGATLPIDDWAKTFADSGALWVANTGYGYADTDTVAYSAKLMSEFAANLNGSLTIGEALSEAKQQYEAGNAILSPYDLKALMESTFYGLPMYTLNGATTPVAPPSGPATVTDPITQLTAAPVSLGAGTLPLALGPSTSGGSYYEVTGPSGGTQTTEFRPIEPLVTVPVTEPNLVPHGAVVTGLTSKDIPDFTPAYSMPAAGSADSEPPTIGDAAFPGTLQRVATFGTFTANGTSQGAELDLVAGQFFPDPSSTTGTGTQRLFTSMGAEVYYLPSSSTLVNDYTPATIDSTQAVSSANAFNFDVQVTPSDADDPVERVLVLYTDATSSTNPATWTALDLSSATGQNWTGAGPDTSSGQAQYIVEAVDEAGNVAVSDNEGADFNGATLPATTQSGDVSIVLSGTGPVSGYYTSAVTATISALPGATYVLDGALAAAVPASGVVTISGNGTHTLSVTDSTGEAEESFAIAASSPVISAGTAPVASPAGLVPPGGALVLDATDPGAPIETLSYTESGQQSQSGSATGAQLPLSLPLTADGSTTVRITATDVAGNTSTTSVIVDVGKATPSNVVTSSAPTTLGSSLTFTATVDGPAGWAAPTGTVNWTVNGTAGISACTSSTATLSATATATCTVTTSEAGTYVVSDSYGGDSEYNSAPSNPLSVSVGKVAAATSLGATTTSPVVGQNDTYTATVSGPTGGATPTGTVSFEDGSSTITCSGGNQTLSGSSNSATATCQTSYGSTTGSPHSITALYVPSSDPNYTAGSVSNPLSVSVGKVAAATSLGATTTSPVVGQNDTYTATVSGPTGGATPTGTVSFEDGSSTITCSGGNQTLSGSSNSATATCQTSYGSTTGSPHSITALYVPSSDPNYTAGSVSNPLNVSVGGDSSTTTLSLSKSSVTYGAEAGETFTATVTGTSGSLPTGTVSVKYGAATLCSTSTLVTKSASTVTATCSLTNVEEPAASYSVTAVYSGDTHNAGATSSPQSLTVNQDSTLTVLQGLPLSVVYGSEQKAVFGVAVLTGNGEALPASEPVTVTVGTASCVASMTPTTLGAVGSCSIAATALPVSSYKVSGTYVGDPDLKASSGTAAVGLTVTPAATTARLSLSASTVTYGNETTEVFSTTVTSLAATPTGTVTVGSSVGTLCQVTLVSGSGSCHLTATQLSEGTVSSVVATYSASGNFAGSSSSKLSFTVSKDTTTTKVSESPTTVTSGAESAAIFTVTVTTGHGEAVPNNETVKVTVGSTSCTVTLKSATGTCKIGNSALAGGSYAVSAAYTGDTNLGSSSGVSSTNLTVSKT
jgi:choice-of-anchor C domain-containing protein